MTYKLKRGYFLEVNGTAVTRQPLPLSTTSFAEGYPTGILFSALANKPGVGGVLGASQVAARLPEHAPYQRAVLPRPAPRLHLSQYPACLCPTPFAEPRPQHRHHRLDMFEASGLPYPHRLRVLGRRPVVGIGAIDLPDTKHPTEAPNHILVRDMEAHDSASGSVLPGVDRPLALIEPCGPSQVFTVHDEHVITGG